MGRFSLSPTPEDSLEPYSAPQESLDRYHVYHYPHAPRRRISIWWWIAGSIVVAHVVARYGPPAPPATFHEPMSWQEFLMHEGSRLISSLIALGSVVPHVWHWCVQGIRQDMGEVYKEWKRPPPCPMLDSSPQEWSIVGQPRAVSIVSDALDAWDKQRPLFLLLAGTVGVGKIELAKQVAQRLFGDCTDAVMVVEGNRLELTQVLQHAQRQKGNGAVVILRHVEATPPASFLKLCQALQREDRVVFVATTGIGTRSIHQHIKQHGSMAQVPKLGLDTLLREEIDLHREADVAEYFHAIAPFSPIGQSELQQILQLNVEKLSRHEAGRQWKALLMTEELATALVDPTNVWYIEWKNKDTGDTILVFSETGAKVLEPGSLIMNKVTAQIKRCLATSRPDEIGKLDYDQTSRKGVISWCNDIASTQICEESCRFPLD